MGVNRTFTLRVLDRTSERPIRAIVMNERTYLDGTPCGDPSDDSSCLKFRIDNRRGWEGPCVALKANSGYICKESKCEAHKAFICQWKGKLIFAG